MKSGQWSHKTWPLRSLLSNRCPQQFRCCEMKLSSRYPSTDGLAKPCSTCAGWRASGKKPSECDVAQVVCTNSHHTNSLIQIDGTPVTLPFKVIAPFAFSDGTRVPVGTTLVIPLSEMFSDDELFANASHFIPLRFAYESSRKQAEAGALYPPGIWSSTLESW